MPRDKTANHIKIIAAAKAEFMEKGFDKSSMRSISKRCGMTAAGIYRHCVDKEDLFDQIVAPAVDRINAWLDAHVARYVGAVIHKEHIQWRDSEIDMMREIIYPNMEEYHLYTGKITGQQIREFPPRSYGTATRAAFKISADAESARIRREGHRFKGAASSAFGIYDRSF